jgi:hypothetical protein
MSSPSPAPSASSPSPPVPGGVGSVLFSDADLTALSRAGLATVQSYHSGPGLREWRTVRRGAEYPTAAQAEEPVDWDALAHAGDFTIIVQQKPLADPAKSASPQPVPVKSPEPAAVSWGGWAASFLPTVVTDSVSAAVGVAVGAATPRYVWKGVGLVPHSPEHLFRLFHDQENQTEWNKALLESRVLRTIKGTRTSVSYVVSAPQAGGAVTSRDFIDSHEWSRTERTDAEGLVHVDYVFAGVGLTEEQYAHPLNSAYVRGLNGPAGFIMRSVRPPASHPQAADPTVRWTQFTLLLDTDVKGWIPKSLTDGATPDVLVEYITNIRNVWQKRTEQNTPLPPMAPDVYA